MLRKLWKGLVCKTGVVWLIDPMLSESMLSKDENRVTMDATQKVGSWMHLNAIKPYLMFVVCFLSKYMEKTRKL